MQIRVLFFGALRDLTGRAEDSISLTESATVGDVLSHYEKTDSRWKNMTGSIAMSVNHEYAGRERKLKPGDEVGMLPPVSGGSGEVTGRTPARTPAQRRSQHAALVGEKIESTAVLDGIWRPEDGAVTVFEGVVRDHTRGRRTLYLDYEAYEEMALKQMEELAERALSQFKIRNVAIVHRLGRLEVGETSVLIVVAAAHRAAAFDACRWLIDTLKRTVPIWKKEYFEDGAVWADGESFPAEVPRAEGTHSGRPASK
jgi:MoaE-MoaD fusion protein